MITIKTKHKFYTEIYHVCKYLTFTRITIIYTIISVDDVNIMRRTNMSNYCTITNMYMRKTIHLKRMLCL